MSAQSPHLDVLLSKLRPFQRSAFEFAVYGKEEDKSAAHSKQKRNYSYVGAPTQKQVAGAGTGRILLGDEMGLGKTLTSLAIMLAYQQEWPLLILCPASLRYTWPAEIEKFCPWISSQSIHVVRGKDDVHFARQIHRWREKQYKSKRDGTEQQTKKCPIQIVIVTYSLLQTRYQIANTLRDCEFECIIADESHNLKQGSSQRCQLALPLLQSSKRLVLLSGTPALNRPVELWPQLSALDSKGVMFGDSKRMTYTEYTKRFCNARRTRFGWDVKGVSNASELHKCLKTVMMRRLKSDVLQDLPAKQRSIVPVTISDKDKERESRDTLLQLGSARQAVSEITDFDADDVANAANWEARKLLMQAYQASGIAKAPSTTEYIIDWLEGSDSTQKLVVFAHHKEVLDYIESTISKRYKGKLGMMRIDGSVPPAERAQRVKKFQTNKHVRLSLLSMTAAGVGLTLTAASNIVFAELHWTPGVLAQAEDRCHRIGQANSVNVMYCICKDEDVSVDMTLWNMLSRKVGNLGAVVDGERAKLNAVEQEMSSKKSVSSNGNGASVEEELTTFFASSKVSSARKQKKGGPIVKGSIQSFFNKAKNTKKPPLVGKETVSTASKSAAECISLLDDDDTDRKLSTAPSVTATISLLEDEDDIQARKKPPSKSTPPEVFVCHVCTFENEADVTACTMCNTPRPSEEDGDSANWSCSKCTYLNNSSATNCDMCQEAKPVESPLEKDYSSNNINDCKPQSSKRKHDQYEFDDEEDFTVEDLAAIDAAASQSTKISQSPIDLSSPINARKKSSSKLQLKSCQSGTTTPSDLLSFSVSRNSGRIALHMSGEPLHVNFDISQVLTKESAEQLEEIHLQRKADNSTTSLGNDISFDDTAVEQVLAVLDDSSMLPPSVSYQDTVHRMCKELKQFVRHYLGLREVEKKVVKESGKAISSSSLKQTAASLVVSTISGSKDRYEGGAKERAITNQLNNCATKEDLAVLAGQACVWCGGPFLCSNGAHYCSYKCAETGRLRRGGMYSSTRIREQLFALEKGVCQMCGVDAHSLFVKLQALQPAERLNCLLNAKWKLPRKCKSTDRLLADPQEHDLWQADHKVAVAEGGGGSGLDNLRTLCTPCHAHETEQLFARLKTLQSEESKDGRTQMDIFSGLCNMSNSSSNKKKRKRRRMAD